MKLEDNVDAFRRGFIISQMFTEPSKTAFYLITFKFDRDMNIISIAG